MRKDREAGPEQRCNMRDGMRGEHAPGGRQEADVSPMVAAAKGQNEELLAVRGSSGGWSSEEDRKEDEE